MVRGHGADWRPAATRGRSLLSRSAKYCCASLRDVYCNLFALSSLKALVLDKLFDISSLV